MKGAIAKRFLLKVILLCLVNISRCEAEPKLTVESGKEIKFSYQNDSISSISIVFRKAKMPIIQEEEWIVIVCVNPTEFTYGCDPHSTRSSTRSKFREAFSHAMAEFNRTNSKAVLCHLYSNNFITAETRQSFIRWIAPAAEVKGNELQSEVLQKKLRTYQFEPVRSDINSVMRNYGFRVDTVDYAVKDGLALVLDASEFMKYLDSEQSWYYIHFVATERRT